MISVTVCKSMTDPGLTDLTNNWPEDNILPLAYKEAKYEIIIPAV
jgi:hypothetical protein